MSLTPSFYFLSAPSLGLSFFIIHGTIFLLLSVKYSFILLKALSYLQKLLSPYLFEYFQIGVNDFRKLTNLIELHLGQNFIEELPENAFIGNRNLEKLYLFFNNLEELKEKTFNGLISLTTLLLNNNLLKNIHSKLFLHTPSVQKL